MNLRVGVIGAGIVGLSLARELTRRLPGAQVTVLEKEPIVGSHQTSHNSGVVHAGIYYQPGSLKAHLCRRGAKLLKTYCDEHAIPFRECGKLVVALDDDESASLRALHDRADSNGVTGLELMDSRRIRSIEPHVRGVLGLFSPSTAVVDFHTVANSFARDVISSGGSVRCGFEVTSLVQLGKEVIARSPSDEHRFDRLVICAGLHGDRMATMAGDVDDPRIVPFRGEYFHLPHHRRHLVNALIYPVPNPRTPFLGIHFTRHIDDSVSVGPNAVLALAREGYRRRDMTARDVGDMLAWPGFRKMTRSYWLTGASEMVSSASRRRYLGQARRYIPELEIGDLVGPSAGVRAQAVDRNGQLVDDFAVHRVGLATAIRNAPSPAATSSLAIADYVCDEYLGDLPFQQSRYRP